MRRLALAAAALALLAAAPVPPPAHAPPHAKGAHAKIVRAPRKPLRVVRAFAVSGTPQTAVAFAAPGETKYQTEFPGLLVVRIAGAPKQKQKRHVRFTCVSKDCSFGAAEQPNKGDGIEHKTDDGNYYVAEVNGGRTAIRVTIEAASPVGTYVVQAVPDRGYGERVVPTSFTLTSR